MTLHLPTDFLGLPGQTCAKAGSVEREGLEYGQGIEFWIQGDCLIDPSTKGCWSEEGACPDTSWSLRAFSPAFPCLLQLALKALQANPQVEKPSSKVKVGGVAALFFDLVNRYGLDLWRLLKLAWCQPNSPSPPKRKQPVEPSGRCLMDGRPLVWWNKYCIAGGT